MDTNTHVISLIGSLGVLVSGNPVAIIMVTTKYTGALFWTSQNTSKAFLTLSIFEKGAISKVYYAKYFVDYKDAIYFILKVIFDLLTAPWKIVLSSSIDVPSDKGIKSIY